MRKFHSWSFSELGGFRCYFSIQLPPLAQQEWPDRAFIINVTEILDQMLEISENVGMAEEINLIFYRPPTRTSRENNNTVQ